jgi:hypothetical protein
MLAGRRNVRSRNAWTQRHYGMGSPCTQQSRVTTDRRSGSSSPAAQQRCSAAAAIRLQMAIRPSADWETGRGGLTPAVTVAALAILQTGAEMARAHSRRRTRAAACRAPREYPSLAR